MASQPWRSNRWFRQLTEAELGQCLDPRTTPLEPGVNINRALRELRRRQALRTRENAANGSRERSANK